MPGDVDKHLERDKRKIRRAWQNRGGWREITIGGALQNVFWLLAILSVAGMILVMPWVGETAVIPGRLWLAGSLGSIGIWTLLALIIRMVESSVDSEMSRGRTDPQKGR